VTVLRSGTPDTLPGRSLNLGERGMAVMLAGELAPGEVVSVQVPLPLVAGLLRTRAIVRYQDKLRCGLEFLALSAEQRATIREWANHAKVETEFVVRPVPGPGDEKAGRRGTNGSGVRATLKEKGRRFAPAVIIALVLLAIAGGVFWWRWNRAWDQLESGLNPQETAAERPQAHVSAEVM